MLVSLYPSQSEPTLKKISLRVKSGSSLAIVGPSGTGRATLVDVMLGLITADSGQVLISGLSPRDAIDEFAGALAYVPQNIVIASGSIRDNVTLGYQIDQSFDEIIWESLEIARLSEFVKSLPEGLNSQVGEFGKNLSGGQRQRLGIARATVHQTETAST
jgi:ABC-type bacteriocin/lantibiotic exporter with double-glycine peptidase domain